MTESGQGISDLNSAGLNSELHSMGYQAKAKA
jgi:hypothetical protein